MTTEHKILNLTNYKDLTSLLQITHQSLPNQQWLRQNTPQMLIDCLHSRTPHTVVGTYHDGILIAVGILYDGQDTQENIKTYITASPENLKTAVNLKIVICHPDHQKQGHVRNILKQLERIATQTEKTELLTTVHPDNTPSINLFTKQGYNLIATTETAYGTRNIYSKQLATHV